MAVYFRENGNRADSEFFARQNNSECDFSSIRYEYFSKHQVYLCRMAKSFSPYSTGWPFSTRILTISPATSDSISFISFIASMMHTTDPFSIKSPIETNASELGDAAL